MSTSDPGSKAAAYLEKLCSVKPNRRTGSAGNRAATAFFARTVRRFGYEVDATPFDCLDHPVARASLGNGRFEVLASPYTLSCDVRTGLVAVSTVSQLERADCRDRILLLRGPICDEQLMPKNFVFYNPEHHRRVVALLEQKHPAAIVAATKRNPDMVGALDPFPLIVDGDFGIPCAHCRDQVGRELARHAGARLRLRIDGGRRRAKGSNVVARLNAGAARKIVLTAHIDAYEDSPGASDNASGTVVLLLLAGMLADYDGELGVEIVALNGEDHYSAAGQMDYLKRYGDAMTGIVLAVNVDDVGYVKGKTEYSLYGCAKQLARRVGNTLAGSAGLVPGEPWQSGDHMVFVQAGVPAVALTSGLVPELMRTVTHTEKDLPEIVECGKLVEVARALAALVRSI
ncbi:Zn-dependent exopeptidase M28 [candidate division WOR-3 bacterium]|uniref:Zn-dependent exopeptidase M28 n=1 Tax=candidate division WOR-3 bacterium TaxID=2052148 RepID=A0A938BSL8_UNCW3|nr:Zn-dependent exopeptidase M28 [candidate division WOR-3 bacterium]